MDILPDNEPDRTELSYDDPVPGPSKEKKGLLARIGQSRVYALEDTSAAALLGASKKRKAGAGLVDRLDGPTVHDDDEGDADVIEPDSFIRANAITLSGEPIGHLDTAKIFAYAAFYTESPPRALEWINDSTAVMIYTQVATARTAFQALMNDASAAPPEDEREQVARPIPTDLWPAQMRIDIVLKEGRVGGLPLTGEIRMRWATRADVKKKGAAAESNFYKTYGEQAGREGRPMAGPQGGNKRRRGDEGPIGTERWQMLGEMADTVEPMSAGAWTPHSRGRRGNGRGERMQNDRHRPAVSKNDLDAELEAFVNDRPPE
ncbi:hypothetical protein FRB96_000081 [Tulasnella sp. 330]|nr:hypothetical protein FRB96_000081 [Tulasnella sp. 330]KAG8884086.1 hypothetical protein FRB97_005309 [Tulasnella sp. 331]KAG8890550.1 hypothetical protein FRB98_007898 [Tulasnella sp. 332]